MHLTYNLINQADWFNSFWVDHQSTLYLWYLLGVHCSCTYYECFALVPTGKISFRTWFFQVFFNKSFIKCQKFVSCLMQYSKKYWKWPETYKLILHSYWTPQFQNFAIPPTWLSSHSITQRYCYPCITFSLHNFKLLTICQLEFLGLVIHHCFFWDFWETMCQL